MAAGLALVAVLWVAPAASAGTLVWNGGGAIWMANDELTAAQPVVTPGSVGMTSLSRPHVQPGGGSTVVFEGSTNQNNHFYQGTFHCGFSCTGVYRRDSNGTVTRLSASPHNGDGTVSSFDTEPEIGTNGRFAYGLFLCTGYVSTQPFTYSCTNQLRHNSTGGGSDSEFPGACNTTALGSPSPRPGTNEVIYKGCHAQSNGAPVLVVAGPNRANERIVGSDDATPRDPSFRQDGLRWVDAEDGGDPGLWDSGFDQVFNFLLRQPAGVTFSSPRYMGTSQDRIVFAARNSDGTSDLWSIPTTCRASTCSFPTSATRITTGGGNTQPAWTSATLISPPPNAGSGGGSVGGGTEMPPSQPAPGSTDGGGGTQAGSGGDTSAGAGGTPTAPTAPAAPAAGEGGGGAPALLTSISVSPRPFRSRTGVTINLQLARPAAIRVLVERVRSRSRRASLSARYQRVGAVSFRGRAGANRLRIRKVARRRLAPGSYRATVIVSDSAGASRRVVKFRVRR